MTIHPAAAAAAAAALSTPFQQSQPSRDDVTAPQASEQPFFGEDPLAPLRQIVSFDRLLPAPDPQVIAALMRRPLYFAIGDIEVTFTFEEALRSYQTPTFFAYLIDGGSLDLLGDDLLAQQLPSVRPLLLAHPLVASTLKILVPPRCGGSLFHRLVRRYLADHVPIRLQFTNGHIAHVKGLKTLLMTDLTWIINIHIEEGMGLEEKPFNVAELIQIADAERRQTLEAYCDAAFQELYQGQLYKKLAPFITLTGRDRAGNYYEFTEGSKRGALVVNLAPWLKGETHLPMEGSLQSLVDLRCKGVSSTDFSEYVEGIQQHTPPPDHPGLALLHTLVLKRTLDPSLISAIFHCSAFGCLTQSREERQRLPLRPEIVMAHGRFAIQIALGELLLILPWDPKGAMETVIHRFPVDSAGQEALLMLLTFTQRALLPLNAASPLVRFPKELQLDCLSLLDTILKGCEHSHPAVRQMAHLWLLQIMELSTSPQLWKMTVVTIPALLAHETENSERRRFIEQLIVKLRDYVGPRPMVKLTALLEAQVDRPVEPKMLKQQMILPLASTQRESLLSLALEWWEELSKQQRRLLGDSLFTALKDSSFRHAVRVLQHRMNDYSCWDKRPLTEALQGLAQQLPQLSPQQERPQALFSLVDLLAAYGNRDQKEAHVQAESLSLTLYKVDPQVAETFLVACDAKKLLVAGATAVSILERFQRPEPLAADPEDDPTPAEESPSSDSPSAVSVDDSPPPVSPSSAFDGSPSTDSLGPDSEADESPSSDTPRPHSAAAAAAAAAAACPEDSVPDSDTPRPDGLVVAAAACPENRVKKKLRSKNPDQIAKAISLILEWKTTQTKPGGLSHLIWLALKKASPFFDQQPGLRDQVLRLAEQLNESQYLLPLVRFLTDYPYRPFQELARGITLRLSGVTDKEVCFEKVIKGVPATKFRELPPLLQSCAHLLSGEVLAAAICVYLDGLMKARKKPTAPIDVSGLQLVMEHLARLSPPLQIQCLDKALDHFLLFLTHPQGLPAMADELCQEWLDLEKSHFVDVAQGSTLINLELRDWLMPYQWTQEGTEIFPDKLFQGFLYHFLNLLMQTKQQCSSLPQEALLGKINAVSTDLKRRFPQFSLRYENDFQVRKMLVQKCLQLQPEGLCARAIVISIISRELSLLIQHHPLKHAEWMPLFWEFVISPIAHETDYSRFHLKDVRQVSVQIQRHPRRWLNLYPRVKFDIAFCFEYRCLDDDKGFKTDKEHAAALNHLLERICASPRVINTMRFRYVIHIALLEVLKDHPDLFLIWYSRFFEILSRRPKYCVDSLVLLENVENALKALAPDHPHMKQVHRQHWLQMAPLCVDMLDHLPKNLNDRRIDGDFYMIAWDYLVSVRQQFIPDKGDSEIDPQALEQAERLLMPRLLPWQERVFAKEDSTQLAIYCRQLCLLKNHVEQRATSEDWTLFRGVWESTCKRLMKRSHLLMSVVKHQTKGRCGWTDCPPTSSSFLDCILDFWKEGRSVFAPHASLEVDFSGYMTTILQLADLLLKQDSQEKFAQLFIWLLEPLASTPESDECQEIRAAAVITILEMMQVGQISTAIRAAQQYLGDGRLREIFRVVPDQLQKVEQLLVELSVKKH